MCNVARVVTKEPYHLFSVAVCSSKANYIKLTGPSVISSEVVHPVETTEVAEKNRP